MTRDEMVERVVRQVGCPLPCMGNDETRRTYREILDVVFGQAPTPPQADTTVSNEAPLTCEFCKNAAATVLLVVDWPATRIKHLVCIGCADRAPADAARLNLPIPWRFPLDDDTLRKQVAERDATIQRVRAHAAELRRCGVNGYARAIETCLDGDPADDGSSR